MNTDLVTACGIYCPTCSRFMDGNCTGCLPKKYKCRVKTEVKDVRFAFLAKDFPGKHIKQLSDKYKKMYNTDLIKNLEFIKNFGPEKFIKAEIKRMTCPKCKSLISIHEKGKCRKCKN
ncbi:MAG: hypothetical protein PHN56_05490 [Candidatus Nanoarchaeia archaeon]|nr:hypothetical protein [Candidatus Nanoarchaeia archaeon]